MVSKKAAWSDELTGPITDVGGFGDELEFFFNK